MTDALKFPTVVVIILKINLLLTYTLRADIFQTLSPIFFGQRIDRNRFYEQNNSGILTQTFDQII